MANDATSEFSNLVLQVWKPKLSVNNNLTTSILPISIGNYDEIVFPQSTTNFFQNRSEDFQSFFRGLLTSSTQLQALNSALVLLKQSKSHWEFLESFFFYSLLEMELHNLKCALPESIDFEYSIKKEEFLKSIEAISPRTLNLYRSFKYFNGFHNIVNHFNDRLRLTSGANELFKTRIVPSYSSDFKSGMFTPPTHILRVAPTHCEDENFLVDEGTFIEHFIQQPYIQQLHTYITELPESAERSYQYPPSHIALPEMFNIKMNACLELASEKTDRQTGTYVREGYAFTQNYPIILSGRLFKCKKKYLPNDIINHPALIQLSRALEPNVFLLMEDKYLTIHKMPRTHIQMASLDFPKSKLNGDRLKAVGIVITTRHIQQGMELLMFI